MNQISGNSEIVTFYVVCFLIYLIVTGRVESVLRSLTGSKDTLDTSTITGEAGTNPPSFGPPSSSPPRRSR